MRKSFLLDLLFPVKCLACGQEGAWLCESCFRKLKFGAPETKHRLIVPELTAIFIAGDYDDPLLSELIKKFKYNFLTGPGKVLGRFLILFWQGQLSANRNLAVAEKFLLLAVPLSKKRRRWRGFNQAEILAQELAESFSYPLGQELKRVGHQKPQAELSEQARLANVRDAFVWTGASLAGQTILLIDDVVTTGATLNEAAKALKAAGAAAVYGLVLAKG